MSSSPPPRAISPPTPAPSPQPDLQAHFRLASAISHQGGSRLASASLDPNDPAPLLKHLSIVLPQLSHSARFRFLSGLVDLFDLRELAHLSSELGPRLKVDFLSTLPIEVSLHILSFIDDPKTLARASRVSRFWRSLVNDEHTWKIMCLKHKYRRRGSSSAGLSSLEDRYLRSVYAAPRPADPRFSMTAAKQGEMFESASSTSSQLVRLADEHSDHAAHPPPAHEDDNMVLASLYQRYRARGLDPSNALHELRTLHDLFLSKQEGGNLADQMSEADRAFYAQLEEIVAEESRERYGDGDVMEEETDGDEGSARPEGGQGPSAIVAADADHARTSLQSDDASSSPSNLGWLGAGASSASAAAARIAVPAHAVSGGYRTPTGRLDRLRGWQEPRSDATTAAVSASRGPSAASATGLGLSDGSGEIAPIPSADINADTDMDVVAQGAMPGTDQLALPSPGPQVAALRNRLPRIPSHDSPTNRFSAHPSTEASGSGSSSSSRISALHGMLRPGRTAATSSAPRLDGSWPESQGAPVLGTSSEVNDASSTKKARRRSAPIADTNGHTLGLGRPSHGLCGEAQRSATIDHDVDLEGEHRPFSYRTHFKLAYLTESNWLRGGRFQTKHTSSDAGAVVTSLAIDSEWIVVGMANSKIHVFDAETGLYSQTLLGHESGVWCLTLISRTGKRPRRRPSLRAAGKSKMVVTDPEDGQGGKPYLAAADGDLCLTHHDPRPDASSTLLSALEYSRYEEEQARRRLPAAEKLVASAGGSGSGISRSSSHSLAFDLPKQADPSGNEETLEWFHKARKAMLQRSTLAGAEADSRTGSPRTTQRHGSEIPRPASASGAVPLRGTRSPASGSRLAAASSAYDEAAAVAEAEAGFIRDAVMSDGTGQVPSHLAEEIERNRGGASMPSVELGGNAAGLGNPCGSVLGYGNEEAIVVSGGCDRDVRVWDLKTGECKYVLSGHTSTTRCLKVLDGRPIAISGSRDSTLRVWDIEKGRHLHLLAGHQHSVRCMEVAGNKVASGSYDCTCRVWDVDTGECLRLLRGHIHQIYAVAFDGKRIATGSLDSTVRVWSMETGECLALFQGHTSLVGQLQLTDNMLVTGGSDGRVIIFSLDTFECIHRLCAHDNSVTCLQFDDRYIVTGGNDGRVKLWDFATGRYIRDVCEPCEQVWKVSYWNDKVVVLCKRDERTCMDVITFRPTTDQF
ncbi:hypothetical protein ACQY0O_003724 [Thecaphora frezii]